MFTFAFLRAVLERAVRAAASSAVGVLTASHVTGAFDVDWQAVAGVAALAAVTSTLISVAASQVGPEGPSFGAETLTEPARPFPSLAAFPGDTETA